MSFLARVVDLFREGDVVVFGHDTNGAVIAWVNVLNAFQKDDVRRDGQAAQFAVKRRLKNPEDPQRAEYDRRMRDLHYDELVQAVLNEYAAEDMELAFQDVQADKKYAEAVQFVRDMEGLLRDQSAPEDDPRWEGVADARATIGIAQSEAMGRRTKDRESDLQQKSEAELIELALEKWIERLSFQEYMAEEAASSIFYALRKCDAVLEGSAWNHDRCDHSQYLCSTLKEARALPDRVLGVVRSTLDRLNVPPVDAGNSGAPASSSESLERPRQEEASTSSTQGGTSTGPHGS